MNKRENLNLITFILLFFLISFCLSSSAVATDQTLGGQDGYPPDEPIELIQSCPNCTFINITTIKLGNGSHFKVNSEMTKDGTFFNYTLTKTQTASLGEYIVNWVADPDGVVDTGSYNLYVNKGGLSLRTGEAILYVILITMNSLAFFFFLHFALHIPYSNERIKNGSVSYLLPQKYLKLLSAWICYGALLWFLKLITGVINTFTYLDTAYELMTTLYIFLFIGGYVFTVVILIILFIEVWKDILVPLFKRLLKNFSQR